MPNYYAAVEVFDPQGPNQAEEGEEYGGEARFFVLSCDDLGEALDTLNTSITGHNLVLTRILHAGLAEDFDDEMLPFEIDIDTMVQTAQEGGEICVSEPYVFEPDPSEGAPSGVYAVCLDVFDPDWAEEDEEEYAGQYQLAVIAAPSASAALAMLLSDCAGHGLTLQAMEGLVDSKAFPFDAYEFEFDEEDPSLEVKSEGGILWSNAYSYPPEAPRKLDS